MKTLMMVVAMSLACAVSFAAQCEGVAQKGERCNDLRWQAVLAQAHRPRPLLQAARRQIARHLA